MQAHARMTPARPTHQTEGLLLLSMGRRRLLLRTGPTSAALTHKNFFGETWSRLNQLVQNSKKSWKAARNRQQRKRYSRVNLQCVNHCPIVHLHRRPLTLPLRSGDTMFLLISILNAALKERPSSLALTPPVYWGVTLSAMQRPYRTVRVQSKATVNAYLSKVSTTDQDYLLGTLGVEHTERADGTMLAIPGEGANLDFELTDHEQDYLNCGLQDLGNAHNGLPHLHPSRAFYAYATPNGGDSYRLTSVEFTEDENNEHLNALLTFEVSLGFDVIERGPEVDKPNDWKEKHLADPNTCYETHVCPYCSEENTANIDREPEYEETAYTCLTCNCCWFTETHEKIILIEGPAK